MSTDYHTLIKNSDPKVWVVTGCAGFIGSNIVRYLLQNNQKVIGVDNFSTGKKSNLKFIEKSLKSNSWKNFSFYESSLSSESECDSILKDVDIILHQAALGSVPRSIKEPIASHNSNVNSFLNILNSAKNLGIKKFIYASSSSVYGDNEKLPKIESIYGDPLSTYALTKRINEMYADVFYKNYNFDSIGLRYFNVFGPMQNPYGGYAAVIPRWIKAMIRDEEISIFGDGTTSRDFCYVDNVIEANILAALNMHNSGSKIYNVALSETTNLNELFHFIKEVLKLNGIDYLKKPNFKDFRAGDIKNSLASIESIKSELLYSGKIKIFDGLKITIPWYLENQDSQDV